MKTFVLFAGFLVFSASVAAQFQEPSGGLFPTDLSIYIDDLAPGIIAGPWGMTQSHDQSIRKNGKASWRWEVQPYCGTHVFWGGWGMDTTVFWVHDNSRVSFWVRPSNEQIKLAIALGFMDGQHDVLPSSVIGPAGEWKYMDLPVPSSAVRRPLNDLKIMIAETGSQRAVLHFDDIRISNTRLFAGRGIAPPITGIYADQNGYDTDGIKTFSSERFVSFQILRVSDNKSVYKGTDPRIVGSRATDDRAAWIGDFTALRTPGRYLVRLDNGKTSFPFDIGPSVYDAPLRAAIRFFYYQRNNTAITMPYAEGPWIHEKDSKEMVALPGGRGTKLVRHGWHDAGDLAAYMLNHVTACFWLAHAWDEFRYNADNLNIPESGDGIPDLLNELRWGLDWIVDMQDPSDGAFYENMCVQSKSPYGYGRTTALTISGYELTNKTTSATAAAVGMLAYAATIFDEAKVDKAFSATMKDAALKGWAYLRAHPKQTNVTTGCDNYRDADDIHGRFFAATTLFLLTGEKQYHDFVLTRDPGSNWISDYDNQENLAYLLYVRSPKADAKKKADLVSLFTQRAQEATQDRLKHPFGFVGYYYWGSLGTAFARVGNYCIPDWRINGNQASLFTALQQLHYTLGQNSLGVAYLSGFGSRSVSNSFHHWLKTLNARPHSFPGMLPGGPNESPDQNDMRFPNGYSKPPNTPIDSRFTDGDSWSTNEVAVNQSAQLLYVLAAAHHYAHLPAKPGIARPATKRP